MAKAKPKLEKRKEKKPSRRKEVFKLFSESEINTDFMKDQNYSERTFLNDMKMYIREFLTGKLTISDTEKMFSKMRNILLDIGSKEIVFPEKKVSRGGGRSKIPDDVFISKNQELMKEVRNTIFDFVRDFDFTEDQTKKLLLMKTSKSKKKKIDRCFQLLKSEFSFKTDQQEIEVTE